ncbi:Thymidine kinase, cytosolic [Holothuria leucospilota]|uniref:Thymidine kinase n=1 Tax=Holothuria leucospilota TaxID=206669 RepID=A0A9Q1C3E6_HOLLE|nr:Thymidine kinase, cytosolic [Holothuria leucospilota]
MMATHVNCMAGFSPCPNKRTRGQVQVIFGPMFSGKTTELVRRIKRYQIANYKCLLIKYAKDVRYDQTAVATHDRQTCNAVSATRLSDLIDDAASHEVIGIDEGQFFPDCVEFAERLADMGRIVIVAALDGTFQREGFGNILNLVPLAENVIKLNAVCMTCFGEASYTKRLGHETALEVIGGADKYMAACRSCYKLSPTKIMAALHTPTAEESQVKAKTVGRKLFPQNSSGEDEDMSDISLNSQ